MDAKTTVSVLFLLSFPLSKPWVLGDVCQLPDCFPMGANISGGLLPSETPQMIILNFHSSIGAQYYEEYSNLLQSRKNPNGCNIRATFFVSHDYTDYPSVNALAAAGHEIGVNTISAESFVGTWDTKRWSNETGGMREILNEFGLISSEDILGNQGPYLQDGRNSMLTALSQNGFKYDSTQTIQYSPHKSPYWPYTLDSRGYPGTWELPIITLHSNGTNCVTLRSCLNVKTKEDAFLILKNNFLFHYNSNKAPLNIIIDPSWWGFSLYANALAEFLDYIQTLDDVYVVTANQAIEWTRQPTPLNELSNFEPWVCSQIPAVGDCTTIYSCHYSLTPTPGAQQRYVKFCAPCPPSYPWVGNPEGS